MPLELNWPGKYGPDGLRREFLYNGAAPALRERNGQGEGGTLVHGDNLAVAPWLLDSYRDQVALVYMDPPFATGIRFSLTAAVGEETRVSAELEAYDDRLDEPGEFFAALAPRLALAHRLLRPDGLFFLHLDARASHGAKLLLDEIFGPQAFRGEIVWLPGNGAKRRSFFALQHQIILAYSNGNSWVFNDDEPSLRQPFAAGSLKSHFRNVDEQGRRFRRRVVNGKEYIYYADEGRQVGSVWTDIPAMTAGSPVIGESTGYPTQKPLKLLERILLACSRPGDLVADLCFGSGTTLAAAQRLGRRWLGCDLGALAVHTARKRLLELNAPFSLWRLHDPPPPAIQASVIEQDGALRVVVENFHTNLDPRHRAPKVEGLALLDAWSAGTLRGGVFEGQWQAQRTRKRRELPLRSGPVVLGQGERLAVCAFDVQGRAVVTPVEARERDKLFPGEGAGRFPSEPIAGYISSREQPRRFAGRGATHQPAPGTIDSPHRRRGGPWGTGGLGHEREQRRRRRRRRRRDRRRLRSGQPVWQPAGAQEPATVAGARLRRDELQRLPAGLPRHARRFPRLAGGQGRREERDAQQRQTPEHVPAQGRGSCSWLGEAQRRQANRRASGAAACSRRRDPGRRRSVLISPEPGEGGDPLDLLQALVAGGRRG